MDLIQAVGAGSAFAGLALVFVLLMRYIGWLTKDRDFWRAAALRSTSLAETSSEVSAVMVGAARPADPMDPLAEERADRLSTVVDIVDIMLKREREKTARR